MPRVIQFRNYGVYVNDERGAQHHLPHAHIKHRGVRVASVYLFTQSTFNDVERVPADLLDLIAERATELLAEWERLNG